MTLQDAVVPLTDSLDRIEQRLEAGRDICGDLGVFAKKVENRTGKKNNGLTADQAAQISAETTRVGGEVSC